MREGVTLLKNGSDCLGHLPLIRCMARTGLPTVISTGMATREDIDDVVQAFRDAGVAAIWILLHCTSATFHTSRRWGTCAKFRRWPRLTSAWSDSAIATRSSTVAAVGAVTLGACFIEKHFTLDKNLPGPDHRFSADPGRVSRASGCGPLSRNSHGCCGGRVHSSEAVNRREWPGLSQACSGTIFLSRPHSYVRSDIAFQRPRTGLPPKMAEELAEKQLTRDARSGALLQPGRSDPCCVASTKTQRGFGCWLWARMARFRKGSYYRCHKDGTAVA